MKVTYIQHCGSDLMVVNAARVSFNSNSKELNKKDEKLIQYLAKNKHMSPFEHNCLTVIIECPLYIRSQIQRHRTFSYNEISRRYTSEDIVLSVPNEFKKQSKDNKQASSEETIKEIDNIEVMKIADNINKKAILGYNRMLELGVSKEQARAFLPQNLMTKFYMTGNLRNWIHFIGLRDHIHAQKEARTIAKEVKNILLLYFPISSTALFNNL